jgi:5-hydroxyisourate hydrolase-like protein (transthyretin family)
MAYPTEFSGQVSGRRLLVVITSRLLALAMLLAGPALAEAVNSAVAPTELSTLHVKLVDSAIDTVLPGQRIDAYQQRTDGRLKWRARGTTNDDGRVSFDLSNRRFDPGLPFILRARPFGSNAYSEPVKSGPGEFIFKVGQLTVKLVSGATGEAMPGEQVVLKRIDANGRHRWVSRNTTDDDGVARFDPNGLGEGSTFVARARSPISGRWKHSDPIKEAGTSTFAVGNKPLLVNLVDALDGSAQPGVRVDAWHRPDGGKRRWLARTETDADGVAHFDIDNLGEPEGPVVSLRAKVFGGSAYASGITAPGPYKFAVGTLALSLRSKANGQLMPKADVHLREVLDDGGKRWAMRGRTDAEGVVRFTPVGIGGGRKYLAKARSPVTRKWDSSEVYSAPGRYEFKVGNVPLVVSMVDGIFGAPMTNNALHAIEMFDDGTRPKWRAKSVTNEDGVALFDLLGLGEGRVYTLYARPFNAGSVRSAPIKEPGKFVFRVGTVPVTLIDGDSGEALAKRKLIAYRLGADDRKHWHRSTYTDETGTVRFDLPGVGEGERYVIKAYKPFGDKQHFYSDPITQEGAVRFEVLADADRVPPQVSVESPAQGMEVGTGNLVVRGTASDDEALAAVRLCGCPRRAPRSMCRWIQRAVSGRP